MFFFVEPTLGFYLIYHTHANTHELHSPIQRLFIQFPFTANFTSCTICPVLSSTLSMSFTSISILPFTLRVAAGFAAIVWLFIAIVWEVKETNPDYKKVI